MGQHARQHFNFFRRPFPLWAVETGIVRIVLVDVIHRSEPVARIDAKEGIEGIHPLAPKIADALAAQVGHVGHGCADRFRHFLHGIFPACWMRYLAEQIINFLTNEVGLLTVFATEQPAPNNGHTFLLLHC
jgi:hypothetical protein